MSKKNADKRRGWAAVGCTDLLAFVKIRKIIGDPTGKLMQDDVVEAVRKLANPTDRQFLDELLRRAMQNTQSNPSWSKHDELVNLLMDAGKIIAQWDGREVHEQG